MPKKSKATGRLIREDDDNAADAKTFETVIIQTKSGNKKQKVAVPLHPLPPTPPVQEEIQGPSVWEHDTMPDECLPDAASEPLQYPRLMQRRHDYMKEYIDRVGDILAALLIHEINPDGGSHCSHCPDKALARWRCLDCTQAPMLCQGCMRRTHVVNPLHRIQRWTGTHFRAASLWEVGIFLRLPCRPNGELCQELEFQYRKLDEFQQARDEQEQMDIRQRQHQGNIHKELLTHRNHAGNAGKGTTTPNSSSNKCDDNDSDNDDDDDDWIEPEHYLPEVASEDDIRPAAPSADGLRNRYLRVVHTNGIHSLALITCHCPETVELGLRLIKAQFLPASFRRLRTLFTVAVLDYFRLCNLELNASAYQFYQLIKRLTFPLSPADVPNLYHELRRMARLWRWLKRLLWGGAAHNAVDPLSPGPGVLSIFCPSCPQQGVNLTDAWTTNPLIWLFALILTADGNFKADHVRQTRAATDVWLGDGAGFFAKNTEYRAFLERAIELHTKDACENKFRAIEQALLSSKACDITGIVAVACARHGCFVPSSIADLFKGEQQKNVDWVFLQALKTTNWSAPQRLMMIYDIACQYSVHLKARLREHLPVDFECDFGIGQFHVHAHKDTCLFRFGTTFIPGAATTIGEILESLWSGLNPVTKASRTATPAARVEMIDDHANDSNHKKWLGLPLFHVQQLRLARDMLASATQYFEKLTKEASAANVDKWKTAILAAEAKRSKDRSAMDIYAARLRGQQPAAGNEHMERPAEDFQSVHGWLAQCFHVEKLQLDTQDHVRRVAKEPRQEDLKKVATMRQTLVIEFDKLNAVQMQVAPTLPAISNSLPADSTPDLFDDIDNENAVPLSTQAGALVTDANLVLPENRLLPVPSRCLPSNHPLCRQELEMRQELIKRILADLKATIADKSFQFSHVLRDAPSAGVRTRARHTVQQLNNTIALHCRHYSATRQAIARILPVQELDFLFPLLGREDVRASTAVLRPNEPGSTQIQLSWIWHHHVVGAGGSAEALHEFERVHWLRARAQQQRWSEEVTLIPYEMQWTTATFQHIADVWQSRTSIDNCTAGQKAYAFRQASAWRQRYASADRLFQETSAEYGHLIT